MLTTSTLKAIEYDKITKDFRASFDGNVIGFFPNYSTAEEALNDHVLLLCQQGLIDQPLAALADDPPPTDDDPEAVNWNSRRRRYRAGRHWLWNAQMYAAPKRIVRAIPDDQPADDFSDVGPERCRNCDGPHATQKCPEILAALFDGPDAGRAIGRQWCRDRARFLTVLANLDRDAWKPLASAYCAWMNRGGCGIAPEHVLLIWTKAVEGNITLPARVFHAADASAESYDSMKKAPV